MVKSEKIEKIPGNRKTKGTAQETSTDSVPSMLRSLTSNKNLLKNSVRQIEVYLNLLEKPKPFLVSSQICSICAYNFNNEDRLPICLPCGHSICKFCVYTMQHSSLTGICPYDRKEYFFIRELLPTNYSLLNSENLNENKICKIHGFEIVGYCNDHDILLCGKCIFVHMNHNFIETDSGQVRQIVETKLTKLTELEENLRKAINCWKEYSDSMILALQLSKQQLSKRKALINLLEKQVNGDRRDSSVLVSIGKLILGLERLVKLIGSLREADVFDQLTVSFKEKPDFSLPTVREIQNILLSLNSS